MSILLAIVGCGADPASKPDAHPPLTTADSADTGAGDPTDTAWFVDTGGRCAPDPTTCDVNCDGEPDSDVVFVRQADGVVLTVEDLPAALSIATDGADVILCPGTYRTNAVLGSDVDVAAWDSGAANRPWVVPAADGPVIEVPAGHSASVRGLTIAGGCGGSGAAVPMLAGGSDASGGSGLSGGTGANGGLHTCGASVGVQVDRAATVSLRNLVIANHGAGGVRATDAALDVQATRIAGNFAEDGGGLDIDGCSAATLTGVALVGNVAGGDGGGLRVTDCEVAGNQVVVGANYAQRGGGLYAEWSAVSGEDWAIVGNHAFGEGGGVALRSSSLDPTPLAISANVAYDGGGGLYVSGASALGAGEVATNVAIRGGGLMVDGDGELDLAADVHDNEAAQGGGLYLAGGEVVSAGNRVVRNRSTDGMGGGAAVESGGALAVDLADWGTADLLDDNDPPDVFPIDLGWNQSFDLDACFACTSESCTACP